MEQYDILFHYGKQPVECLIWAFPLISRFIILALIAGNEAYDYIGIEFHLNIFQ